MTTDKAHYRGNGAGQIIDDFSQNLRDTLRNYYPNLEEETVPVFGHPADEFVNILLGKAWRAKKALHWLKFSSTKGEIRAEHADLLKTLEKAQKNLRTLSIDFDRLLGVDADPLGCADKIGELIQKVRAAEKTIECLPDKRKAKKPEQKKREIAVNLAIDIIRILQTYGLSTGATVDEYGHTSNVVNILKSIGDDIELDREVTTWKKIVIDANERERIRKEKENMFKK